MTNEQQPTPDAIMQLGLAFWGSKALLSAVELDLFSTLAAGAPDPISDHSWRCHLSLVSRSLSPSGRRGLARRRGYRSASSSRNARTRRARSCTRY
jgi:hypothetical protein